MWQTLKQRPLLSWFLGLLILSQAGWLFGTYAGPWFTNTFGLFSPFPALVFALASTAVLFATAAVATWGLIYLVNLAIQSRRPQP
jgi:hypothetical protein